MSALDPRARFNPGARLYAAHRPTYPAAAIDWILAQAPGARRVADLACGTGIAARLLAARGLEVVGIDPSGAMLDEARAAGGGPTYRAGEAAATGLPDASIDVCTVAQAFHWFDVPRAVAEIGRILAPGGRLAIMWNLWQPTELREAYDALLRRASVDYRQTRAGPDETRAALRASPALSDVREAVFEHAQRHDRAGFFGRIHSASYVVHGVGDGAAFDAALGDIFDRFAVAGELTIPYRTVVLAALVAAP